MKTQKIYILIRNEKIKYLFWGVITTIFYFFLRLSFDSIFKLPIVSATLSEFFTILFAFFVNRKYVFTSEKKNSLAYQLITFFLGRIAVAIMDIVITYITIEKYSYFFIHLLRLDTIDYNNILFRFYIIKNIIGTPYQLNNIIWIIIIQVSAIIINYLVSKYWSFK